MDELNITSSPAVRRWRRRAAELWQVVRWMLVIYLSVVLLAMFLEESLIFFPFRYPAGEWQPAGLVFEDANFTAADGVRLHGWYVPHDSPKAVLLFCHGNAGNVTHRAEILQMLNRRAGVAVLCFDYRGYGRSEGRPNEPGVLADARAARKWLATRAGVAESDIVLLGESLGGAVATIIATDENCTARALVLQGAFTSIADVAAYHYPFLPVRWLLRTRLDAAAHIDHYHGPVLLSHGDSDTIVPLKIAQRLFELANEPKRFLVLPGHDHNDPLPPAWYAAVAEFLSSL